VACLLVVDWQERGEGIPLSEQRLIPLWVIRVLFVVSWLFFTVVLLVPDPYRLLGLTASVPRPPRVGTHTILFAVLGFLAATAFAPRRRLLLFELLIGYAVATELLQGLVPKRTPDFLDFVEDLLGLGLGFAIYWGGACLHRGLVKETAKDQPGEETN